jgi:hypothetical protein
MNERVIQALYRPADKTVVPKFRESGKSLKELMDKSHFWLDTGYAEFWDVSTTPPILVAQAFPSGLHFDADGKALVSNIDYGNAERKARE